MGRLRAPVGWIAGIVGFIVLVLCGLGAATAAIALAAGAPHAFPSMPGLAAIALLVALLCWAGGVVLLRRSVGGMSSLWNASEQPRARKWLYSGAVTLFIVVIATMAFPFYYEPARPARDSIAHGNYLVEPPLRSACSSNAHRVFYQQRLITKVAGTIMISPHNPDRLLYVSACSKDGSEAGVFYVSGTARQPVQVNPLGIDPVGEWFNSYWSPDDRFVIVPAYGNAPVVNLDTGQASPFLDDVFEVSGAFGSSATFRGWSRDGKRFAMVIEALFLHSDDSRERKSDLVAVDPGTLARHVVASKLNDEWKDGDFAWVLSDGRYELRATERRNPSP